MSYISTYDPMPGDIVTVRVRNTDNAQHYRHAAIWKVLAVNQGTALVTKVAGFTSGDAKEELWPIACHYWYPATGLKSVWDKRLHDRVETLLRFGMH